MISERQCFEVPPDKVAASEALMEELQVGANVTPRQLARVAGKIMAISLAVSRALLHSRLVGQAAAGKASWDEAPGPPEAF
ncbi:hypothetical protein GPECTOR_72g597 [Gonium pectorale]|uniref:Uncharacterized protein n=1 Tax=Gonium pectorale TaxID=33097 RepID=A0A150G4C5_GONPE|nr:hypothetical protein GPECTOR_72g597 [Gonium pectorale]|eukprot:KXZ44150.1 hypothetical protein GPECTOR_72g597 [Gonium pectorale]